MSFIFCLLYNYQFRKKEMEADQQIVKPILEEVNISFALEKFMTQEGFRQYYYVAIQKLRSNIQKQRNYYYRHILKEATDVKLQKTLSAKTLMDKFFDICSAKRRSSSIFLTSKVSIQFDDFFHQKIKPGIYQYNINIFDLYPQDVIKKNKQQLIQLKNIQTNELVYIRYYDNYTTTKQSDALCHHLGILIAEQVRFNTLDHPYSIIQLKSTTPTILFQSLFKAFHSQIYTNWDNQENDRPINVSVSSYTSPVNWLLLKQTDREYNIMIRLTQGKLIKWNDDHKKYYLNLQKSTK